MLPLRFLLIFVIVAVTAAGQAPEKPKSIAEKTAGMQKLDGFFPLYWDEAAGSLLMEIPRFDAEVFYYSSLAAGLGSNDTGLDRGQLGDAAVVIFRRIGPKVLMVQPNQAYRVTSNNADERLALEEAFATSTLWGFTVVAESGGRVLVDMTDFLLRDTHSVAQRLKPANYKVDRARSAVYMPRTRAFPKNTEMEALLTFVTEGDERGPGQPPGTIADVTPTPAAITLRLHHSFVEVPDASYKPRKLDSRSGYFGITYVDYSAPLGEPMRKQFIARHRLEKKDPAAAMSDPVEPIIYYLDRGTPEPIRSALLEGARWWNQAYEAAGYRDAFRVEMLPEGADPLDVRYNVIQWVHRSTRGWAYGSAVVDPRTGEILKGHVTLDSLRVRQDYLIAEGLLAPYEEGTETPPELSEMALARLRQLSAHEVGHTLGLAHNYYDSDKGRISVMDYPHPLVKLRADGRLDLSDAYATGIGEWDKVAVTWGYQDFAESVNEEQALDAILERAWKEDLRFMTNQDLGVNPRVDQWAHGTNTTEELQRVMKVRRVALDRFGENVIKRGWPLALMEEALVPLFLHHRFQVEATASALGGQYFTYATRGDGREPLQRVPAAEQRGALDALMATLRPSELAVPRSVLDKLPPRPPGFETHRELFPRYTGATFDPFTPAVVAADFTVTRLVQADRAARMVAQHAIDPALPGFDEVTTRLVTAGYEAPTTTAYEREIRRTVRRLIAERLMGVAATAPMPQVRAVATAALRSMQTRSRAAGGAFDDLLAADIQRFLERPAEPQRTIVPPQIPPGAPIG